jgi:cyclomaltodextrinase / maltogenic alpha-amylase / neopullulanase
MKRLTRIPFYLAYLALLTISVRTTALAQKPTTEPPSWAREVVWYEIFVERFANGDTTNDPRLENMGPNVPAGWAITP